MEFSGAGPNTPRACTHNPTPLRRTGSEHNFDQDGKHQRVESRDPVSRFFFSQIHRWNPSSLLSSKYIIRIVVVFKQVACLLFYYFSSYNSAALHLSPCSNAVWVQGSHEIILYQTRRSKHRFPWGFTSCAPSLENLKPKPRCRELVLPTGSELRPWSWLSGAQIPVLSLSTKRPCHFTYLSLNFFIWKMGTIALNS